MPKFMWISAIVKTYQSMYDVLCEDGKVYRIPSLDWEKSYDEGYQPVFVDVIRHERAEEPIKMTGKTLNYRQYIRSGGIQVYLGIIRENEKSTTVVLPSYDALRVPREEMVHWHWLPSLMLDAGDYDHNEMQYLSYLCMNDKEKNERIQLEDMTFGIEFEFSGLRDEEAKAAFLDAMKALVGSDRITVNLEDRGAAWNLGHDSSIKNEEGYFGYELQSPILHFCEADYQEMQRVLELVKTILKGRVDASCGTHVHFGSFLYKENSLLKAWLDEKGDVGTLLEMFASCYGQFEKMVFDCLVEWGRRKNNSEYCRSCLTNTEDRSVKMNRTCYSSNQTLENRQHQGTLDAEDIWHWIELNGRFVLQYFKDKYVFENVHSIDEFFEAIGLQETTRQYYQCLLKKLEFGIVGQINKVFRQNRYMSSGADEDSTGDPKPAKEIVLQVLKDSPTDACA